uniref:Exostosin GT47 domain-containing protein n=2 Tax=Alexandrium monilatum TaxID=311494 RepID=A0A7S4RCV8_9DINO
MRMEFPVPNLARCLAALLVLPVASLRLEDAAGAEASSVPFYMYDLPHWSEGCTDPMFYMWGDRVPGVFHQNEFPDVALYEVLKDHPWRVKNGDNAKLFVVPGYFGSSYKGMCGNHEDNMAQTAQMLEESPWYQRSRGSDHLISAFEFSLKPGTFKKMEPYVTRLIVLHLEKRAYYNRSVVVPYGPLSARGVDIHEVPPAKRRHSLFFMGQADVRPQYQQRRRALHLLPASFNDSVLIQATQLRQRFDRADTKDDPAGLKERLPNCEPPELVSGCKMKFSLETYARLGEQSNYSLVIEGDSPSTSRLYDAMQFGQVPIIISSNWKEIAMPFPDELPWDDLAVFLSPDQFVQDPVGTMSAAVKEASRSARWKLLEKVRFLLDWHHGGTCIGTAVLSDVGRRFLGLTRLPPAWKTAQCEQPPKTALARYLPVPKPRKFKVWLG